MLASQEVVFNIKPEPAQVQRHPDLQCGSGKPGDTHDEGDQQQVSKQPAFLKWQRCRIGCERDRHDHQLELDGTTRAGKQRPPERLIADEPGKDQSVDDVAGGPGEREGDQENRGSVSPVRHVSPYISKPQRITKMPVAPDSAA